MLVQQQPPQMQMPELASQDDIPASFVNFGCCLTCVDEGTVGVVQRCGAFQGFANPGCVWYIPVLHTVTPVSIAVKQMMVNTDCKTKDDVTVTVTTAVQYFIQKTKIEDAVFLVEQPEEQIRTGVNNIVRSELPDLNLDDAYENKDALRGKILDKIKPQMTDVGYMIRDVMITDLHPDRMVLASMNQINASVRQRQASVEQGEAQKVLLVKKAEAEAESKALSGQGLSRMRIEIAKGFKQSMDAMKDGGLDAKESMNMMITTQYVDMLKDFAVNPNKTAIMVPAATKGKK